MDAYQIVIRPLITEKGTDLNEGENQYPFQVHRSANKLQIAHAVQQIYGVRVTKVRTLNHKGKPRRFRYNMGRTPQWKKAIVTLHEDDRIDLF